MHSKGPRTNRTSGNQVRWPTIVAYLLAAFAVSLATLVTVTAMTTRSSFERERRRSESELRIAAQRELEARDDVSAIEGFFQQMTSEPAMAALDPVGCQAVFDGLQGLVDVNVHLVRTDGSEVCALHDARAPNAQIGPGPWLEQTLATEGMVMQPPAISPSAHTPAILTSMRVSGPEGPVGAVVSQIYTGFPAVQTPKELPRQASIFVVDRARSLVLATTGNRSSYLGVSIDGRPKLDGDTIAVEATSERTGFHAQAVLPKGVALAAARAELRRMLLVGGSSVLVVLMLGVLLHRRVARPMRGLRQALLESLEGDASARAPIAGPAEVAEAAEIFNDLITERHAREAELVWEASHDALTGLANRAALLRLLDDRLGRERHEGTTPFDPPAVVLLDLDNFKAINDSLGHSLGDSVLVEVARRLQSAIHPMDTVARLGADQFVVMVEAAHAGAATATADRLLDALRPPIAVVGHDLVLHASAGVAIGEVGQVPAQLLANADSAMYAAKGRGKGHWQAFKPEMQRAVMDRLALTVDLAGATDRGEIFVMYQPIIELATGRPVGAEALVRWNHPARGLISPLDFISIAEESGRIADIGTFVLGQALDQLGRCQEHDPAFYITVNVSPVQFRRPEFLASVDRALEEAGVDPRRLVLEITETGLMTDVEDNVATLTELRGRGIRMAIDDFGTGYSSIAYLNRLPVDIVKIDKSLVDGVATDPGVWALAQAILGLVAAVGLDTVAEGIEDSAQVAHLEALGCTRGQGYHFARPMAADHLTDLMVSARRLPQPA